MFLKKQKWVSGFLIALSIIMVITGCSNNNEGTTSTPATEVSPTNTASDATSTEEPKKEREFMEISIAGVQFGDDDIGKKIAEDLNIKIKPIPLSVDALDQLKLFAASGNFPDVVQLDIGDYSQLIYQWIDQKVVRELPEEMLLSFPSVKRTIEASALFEPIKEIKKGVYYVPKSLGINNYYKAHWSGTVFYRQDWLANVGITKEPETIDEWYEMLKAFTDNDPDGNGKNDTYGLTSASIISPLYSLGVDVDNWVEEDGQWIPAYASKQMIEPLHFFRKIYQEGYLDPEFSINTANIAISKFSTGLMGSIVRNSDNNSLYRLIDTSFGAANADKGKPLVLVSALPPLATETNGKAVTPLAVQEGATLFSNNVSDEKLERVLELYEYLNEPENRKVLLYGYEGKEYKIEGDVIVPLENPKTNAPYKIWEIPSVYPSAMMSNFTNYGFDNYVDLNLIPEEYKEMGKIVRDRHNAAVDSPVLTPRFLSTPAKDAFTVNLRDEITFIIMGKDPVEEMFAAFIEESNNKGLAKAIEEVNTLMSVIR